MFKKRNRQNTSRRGIQREESSEEETTLPIVQNNSKNEHSLSEKDRVLIPIKWTWTIEQINKSVLKLFIYSFPIEVKVKSR